MDEKKVNLAIELEFAIEPIRQGVRSLPAFRAWLGHLGFELPILVQGLQTASSELQGLINQIKAIANRAEGTSAVVDLIALIDPIWDFVDSLQSITLVDPPAEFDLPSDLAAALERVPELLLIRYIDHRAPPVTLMLRARGLRCSPYNKAGYRVPARICYTLRSHVSHV